LTAKTVTVEVEVAAGGEFERLLRIVHASHGAAILTAHMPDGSIREYRLTDLSVVPEQLSWRIN
jgi:hypothetical protein